MSKLETSEDKLRDVADAAKRSCKCRIPLRLPAGRQKKIQYKPKTPANNKTVMSTSQQPRFAAKAGSRPHSSEQKRPNSANRMKDVAVPPSQSASAYPNIRPSRPERERLLPAVPKQNTPVLPKRAMNNNNIPTHKSPRPIMVPITQKQHTKTLYTNRTLTCLPDQETINRHEDLELKQSEIESITSRKEKLAQLKINWQEKSVQFEKLKNDLNEKQKIITDLYASLGATHKKMSALGQKTSLPTLEDFQMLNVANLSPEQLLQICANEQFLSWNKSNDDFSSTSSFSADRLYHMQSKLVSTCEQTLDKNKELINELEVLLSSTDKNLNLKYLLKKIKEFNADNEILSSLFDETKNEFIIELNDIVSFIRKILNERRALHIQNDKLICDISELNSHKDDLRKQLNEANHRKSYINKNKLEELEKQFKDEKCKNTLLKDRLVRVSDQVKIKEEYVSQLNAALEQARSTTRSLERTVQQLKDQNQQLNNDFGKEFNKFSESIRENTAHLEEIAEAREKLQAEKEDLEKRLNELSANYNESIKNMKKEMNMQIAKVIENEKKYDDEKEERLKLVDKVESLCSKLIESELRYKELCKQLQDKELQLGKSMEYQKDLESTKHQLEAANAEIEKYRNKFVKQNEDIKEIEQKTLSIEENMKCELRNKEEYTLELEKQVDLLEQKRQESENKMVAYEEQLASIKQHLTRLQEDYGEFENLSELHDMINQQRVQLLDATRQNGELAEALQNKNLELEQHLENISDQEHIIEQRDGIIKMLSEKEGEHANIIKLLRNNLEMRTQADLDLNQQLSKKNSEIDSLITNLETRKQQITQLEKMILILEDQVNKTTYQRKKDQEKIKHLENKLNDLEILNKENERNTETPSGDLDNIIKILEDELISPLDPIYYDRNTCTADKKKKKLEIYDREHKDPKKNICMYDEGLPTKIIVDHRNKESISSNITNFVKSDNLDRQRGITNIQNYKWTTAPDTKLNILEAPLTSDNSAKVIWKDGYPTRNLNLLTPIQLRDDKKGLKLLKIAGHRL